MKKDRGEVLSFTRDDLNRAVRTEIVLYLLGITVWGGMAWMFLR